MAAEGIGVTLPVSPENSARDQEVAAGEGDSGSAGQPDWDLVRIEYGRDEESVDSIAARHRVTRSAINWRCTKEGWPKREDMRVIDRAGIIQRMFKVLDRQLFDLEDEMRIMRRKNARSGEKEVVVLGKLAGNLEKLVAIDSVSTPRRTADRRTKQMEDLRGRLIERIEQLKRG